MYMYVHIIMVTTVLCCLTVCMSWISCTNLSLAIYSCPGTSKQMLNPTNFHHCTYVYACDAISDSGEVVSYSEVEHWMWRLFLDDFGEVCEFLGLSSCLPFSSTVAQALPLPTPLLYGISPTLLPRQPYWPQRYSIYQCRWVIEFFFPLPMH